MSKCIVEETNTFYVPSIQYITVKQKKEIINTILQHEAVVAGIMPAIS